MKEDPKWVSEERARLTGKTSGKVVQVHKEVSEHLSLLVYSDGSYVVRSYDAFGKVQHVLEGSLPLKKLRVRDE